MHTHKKATQSIGVALSLFLLFLSLDTNLAAMDIPKDNRIAIEGIVVDIKSMPLSKESSEQPFLLIIVQASKLTDKEGKHKINNELWILKIPEENKETFKEYKPTYFITAYGYREGKARILSVLGEGLGPSKSD